MIYDRCMYFLYPRRCLGVMFILASNKWHTGMPAHFTGVNVSYGAPLCFLSTLFDRSFVVTLCEMRPRRSVSRMRAQSIERDPCSDVSFDLGYRYRDCSCNPGFESLEPLTSNLHVHRALVACPFFSMGKRENLFYPRTCHFSLTFD